MLVPWRTDNGHREKLWRYVRSHLERRHDYPIFEGISPLGPFNRAAAINDAARRAGDWQVAIISDADTIVTADQLEDAVDLAAATGRLVAAFTTVTELDKATTMRRLLGNTTGPQTVVRIRNGEHVTRSSVLALTRPLWDRVGCFDEQFVGWSAEDEAFWAACTIHAGEPLRIDGTATHLWHRSVKPSWTDPQYQANQRRWKRYAAAETVADLETIRCE